MATKRTQTYPPERRPGALLRGVEVAAELGISRSMAYKLMGSGVLPTVRIPGSSICRVPAEALKQWVKDRTRTAEAA